MRTMHPNREGSYAHRHAIQAYGRHGLSVHGHDSELPLDRSGVALDYHYEEGLVEAGASRQHASDLVEALRRCQRSRWNAARLVSGGLTVLALLAVLAAAAPVLAQGTSHGGTNTGWSSGRTAP